MKTVIITGAGGSLGRALVKKFVQENYFIAATLSPGGKVKQPEKKGQLWQRVNLAAEDDTAAFVKDIIRLRKRADVLVATAGGFAMGNIAKTRAGDIQHQVDLNFFTAYNIVRPVFLQMKKQGSGRIFLIGSKAGADASGGKEVIGYSLSKSLLFRLADILNKEAAGTDIVTTVIIPSTIDTPQNRKDMPGADFSTWVKPAAIAEVISFYASSAASAIRSPVVKVYGGA